MQRELALGEPAWAVVAVLRREVDVAESCDVQRWIHGQRLARGLVVGRRRMRRLLGHGWQCRSEAQDRDERDVDDEACVRVVCHSAAPLIISAARRRRFLVAARLSAISCQLSASLALGAGARAES